ncbi:MAG: phosphatidylcholine synthase [Rhodomicrobium sp.]|nr:phosphatidylcholine synthase [Rhodomicrobium sp.]
MRGQLAAFGVHVFTAIGAVLGFQALIEASAQRWEAAFAWLGAALVVDGLDGPMARRIGVAEKLPRFSGERLDLIIDYLTYVVVPAYIIYQAALVPSALASAAAAIILVSSLFHFIDRDSKTKDGFFVGFPAIWNVVALYLFIFPIPAMLAFMILTLLALLTFLPFKWVHPVRVRLLRPLTFCAMGAWGAATVAALIQGFPGSTAGQATIAVSSVYMLAIGLVRSFGSSHASSIADR